MNKQEYKIAKIKFFNQLNKLIEEHGIETVFLSATKSMFDQGKTVGMIIGFVVSLILFGVYLLIK